MMTEKELKQKFSEIGPLYEEAMEQARKRQEKLAKPPGSLGKLEDISVQLAGMTGLVKNRVEERVILTYAADNGVVEENVASAPQSVTWSQTINLTLAKTGASALAKHFGNDLYVIDVGVNADTSRSAVIQRKVAMGTKNLRYGPAMTREECIQAMAAGFETGCAAAETHDILGIGEMGIGNTTTSSAILSVLTGLKVEEVTGRGGGINDESFLKKKQVISESIALNQPDPSDPIDVLSKVGGFDIAAMCGAFLAAAYKRTPVVIDGFISSVAALCASRLSENAKYYFIPSHKSFEIGYMRAMDEMGLQPMLELGMRLGEGSGCPLAFEVVDAACAIMCDMATFDEAGINDEYLDEIRATDSFTVVRE